ncbi:glycosylphosphatidylinositol anchor biosynthesis [Rhizina undulata]
MPTPIPPQASHRPSPPRLSTPVNDHVNPAWRPATLQLPQVDAGGTRSATSAERRTGSNIGRPPKTKRRRPWRKLLWVKQDYPDNWVDPTFLSQLQRNINVQPYDFYSLVADSTVIVQHLSSVMIFVTSFIAIFKERVSPVTVVMVSTVLTAAGWAIWDMGWEKREAATERAAAVKAARHERGGSSSSTTGGGAGSTSPIVAASPGPKGLGLEIPGMQNGGSDRHHLRSPSGSSGSYFPPYPASNASTPSSPTKLRKGELPPGPPVEDKEYMKKMQRSRRLTTVKSALLIFFTLLGLSPILRSLTTSISSDSIWAIATWLFLANCLSFDYGSGIEVKFPASLSTNAAITSSVVLASRLPSTTHVFSLILFAIEVFGLFPVFRRYIKFLSWNLHMLLTVVLVLGAAAGLGAVVGWGWAVVYVMGVVGGMGGCGWWLISLQKYKNEIHGPWDPARPVIRRQWE